MEYIVNKLKIVIKSILDKINPFKGQKGQDKWVILNILPLKRRGYFLDLAAADGITHSNTYVLEKYFDWNGICVEPNPTLYQKLKLKRKCIIDCSAVSDRREKVKFRIDNGQFGGIVAKDTDNNTTFRGEELVEAEIIELETVTINEILEFHDAPKIIDYFSLDIEGSEERIIRTLNFKKYIFKCITIERPTAIVNEILFNNDYIFVKNNNYDSFYVHKSLLYNKNIQCRKFEQVPGKNW